MDIPFSDFASDAARAVFIERIESPPPGLDVLGLRRHYTQFNDALARAATEKYAVDVAEETWGGVSVQRVTSRTLPDDRRRGLLINLHGGGFMWGAGSGALVEAIPVAAVANTTVITVNYRMAPEHVFPVATDDVCAVYEAALKTHKPGEIGIYGCSAGAVLTTQTIALLERRGMPLPGAIAMLCGAGADFRGDSSALSAALMGSPQEDGLRSLFDLPYMQGARPDDPLALPACDDRLLAAFPPSLLLTASRDFAASSVTSFHRQLIANGVDARLLVFDGLWHAFQIFCDLPEAEEAHRVLADFFERTLHLKS